MTRRVCRSLALLASTILPTTLFAQQITVVDGMVSHTDVTGAFVTRALPNGFPTNLTTPDNYANGTLHHRVQVTATPGAKLTSYQLCLVQGANKACSDPADLQFMAAGTVQASQTLATFDQIGTLDLTTALDNVELVVRDANGFPVDATDTQWDGSPDFALYYPLSLTYQAVMVAQGGVFAGFPGETENKVANPTFSPAPGSYTNSVNVTLSSATADAEIRYTTDGSDPDMTSTLYAQALQLTSTTTVKAAAFKAGLTASDIVSGTYTVTAATEGLTGRYYNGASFGELAHTRVDPSIDFTWEGGQSPAPNTSPTFSVIWTGTVTPRYSEQFTFKTLNDDGVRVWINNQLIINDPTSHGPQEFQGNILLQANQAYPVWIEYFNGGGGARMRFSWVSASQPEEVIPDTALNPVAPASATTVSLLMDEQFASWAETSTMPIVMEVRRRGNLDNAVRVELEYSGTAENGVDVEQLPAYIDLPAGVLSNRLEIQPIIDGLVEGEETFTVKLKDGAYELSTPSEQTVALQDFDRNSYTLAGRVNYTGTTSGKIFVQAFTDEDEEFEKRSVVLADPGAFAITDIAEGSYNVVAFIDTNDNERLDTGEVWTQYTEGDAVKKVTIPPNVSDVVLTLVDGVVKAEDGDETSEDDGCSTAAGGQGWLVLSVLGVVALFRRRRS